MWDSPSRILEWVAVSFSGGIFPTQESNLGLLHCRQIFTILAFLWTACRICTVHFMGLRATRLHLLQPLEVNTALLTPCPSLPSQPGSFKTLIILVLSTPCLSFGWTPLPGSEVWPQCPRQEPQCPEAVPASPHSPLFPFSTSSSKTSPSSAKIRLSS